MAEDPTPKQTGIVIAWFVFAAVALWLARHSTDENNQAEKPVPKPAAPITRELPDTD